VPASAAQSWRKLGATVIATEGLHGKGGVLDYTEAAHQHPASSRAHVPG